MDPRVVRGAGPRRWGDDRVLVACGEAVSARPEPGLPWSRAPPRDRVGDPARAVAWAGRCGDQSAAFAFKRDEERGRVGGLDRLPGGAPELSAGLRGAATRGLVDREQP